MAEIDFATVGDDIMVTGAFLLRQTLSEWYRTQSWYPSDLEKHARELAAVPRVLWMGPSSYTSFFINKIDIQFDELDVCWGFRGRSAVFLSKGLLENDENPMRTLDMRLANLRRDIRVQAIQQRNSPGLKIAAKFVDPITALRTMPPTFMAPEDHIRKTQYMIAVASFLMAGFDTWCWGESATGATADPYKLVRRT